MTLAASLGRCRGDLVLDAAFAVEPGEVLAILGPNGAGKTTILRALAGLDSLDSGRITVDDLVLDDPAEAVFLRPEQRSVGLLFQDYLLFPHLSVLDNVAFGPRARGVPKAEAQARAQALLDRFELGAQGRASARALSGGQLQRVALARALATDPRLLLLDEPLAALDATVRPTVRRDLRRHLAEFDGYTVLVTHDPLDALSLAGRVLILEAGRVTQAGTMAEVTPAAVEGLALTEGSEVWATVKATEVTSYPA